MNKADFPSRLKIVTVDASPLVTKRILSILTEMHSIEFLGSARNFVAALDLINRQVPDVVILDINLDEIRPHANGIDLLIALRQKYPDIKIIMFTNLTLPQYRDRCLAFGADYFFDKTNDFEDMIITIDSLTKAKRPGHRQ